MIKTVRGLGLASVALVLTVGLAACGSDNNDGGTGTGVAAELSGDVKVDGSSTVGPLSKAAAELFADEQAKVNVTVGISGTGGGFKKFCNGETDISDASRPIKDTEKAECEKNGVKFVELIVANDALSVVVSKDNSFADCLTVPQLKAIWEPGSKVNNWNQVDPKFPNEPLKLFGAGTDSGTFDYWTAAINGKEKAHRTDYTPTEDDNVTVQGVSGSKGGLGYFGFTYYEENADKLKLVKVDGGGGCVEPSVATAQDGSYKPLSRPLFIYVSDKGIAKEQVKGFVDFYIASIDEVVKEAKYVPLTAAQKETLKSEFATLTKG
ncbi:PstS family phosphate ABC transporter substrate-binding protein [Micromonospora parastrephiae]|uniref:PstS family phosphate ABC transporter substrate-binding protein n=1 Tax=Micromonospora parastrephiae TaxID=2806101 RepID=UPI00281532F0|nr:PstS family phosphate ABC transporter substrate-binding protein [Micromonospora parastrephiae]